MTLKAKLTFPGEPQYTVRMNPHTLQQDFIKEMKDRANEFNGDVIFY